MISPSELNRAVLPLEFEVFRESNDEQAGEVVEEPTLGMNADETRLAELELRLRVQNERTEQKIETACEGARAEVREELTKVFEEGLAAERSVIAKTCEQFARERERYFTEVEAEVVRLALAIAARVLHRETMLDPLLLLGVVRVALEKVQEEGNPVLRVPEEQTEEWSRVISSERDGVVVAGDGRLQHGECLLETSVGRVDLGVKAQLEEVEKGFFDLLERRPA